MSNTILQTKTPTSTDKLWEFKINSAGLLDTKPIYKINFISTSQQKTKRK